MLIQLAKQLFEVEWIATTSTHAERGFCEDCGADEVFDFQASPQTHWASPFIKTHHYDIILDCVSDPQAFRLLSHRGKFSTLLTGETPPGWFSGLNCCKPLADLPQPDGEVLERVAVLSVLEKISPKFTACKWSDAIDHFLKELVDPPLNHARRLLVIQFD